MFFFIVSVLFSLASTGICSAAFPPAPDLYSGDYIHITEPGRYTLEHSLSHQYPAGVIIAAPSVILDGQGFSIHPASAGKEPSVGIWVSLTDAGGRPVTGVTIRNVSVTGEGYGIYVEGINSSESGWGIDRTGDAVSTAAASSPRNIVISGVNVSSCSEGVVLQNVSGAILSDTNISMSAGSGIRIEGGSGYEISGSRVEDNGEAGIRIDHTDGIIIYNSILNNKRNLKIGSDSAGIVLATDKKEGTNVIGGTWLGGNYWGDGSGSLSGVAGIIDADGDGIGDSPYDTGSGVSDPRPLVKPGTAIPVPTSVPEPVVTQTLVIPLTTPAPVATPLSMISGIHAVIISDTIPAEMDAGKTYPVSLSLYNDGSEDWIAQHQIGIMALDEAAKLGPAWMSAPVSGPVETGQTVKQEFTLKAPSQPGAYTLKYQAGREGSGIEVVFGRPYTKTITVR